MKTCACGCELPVLPRPPHAHAAPGARNPPSPGTSPGGPPKIYATRKCAARARQRRKRGGLSVPCVVQCRVCKKGVVSGLGDESGSVHRRRYHPECAKIAKKARGGGRSGERKT